MPRLTARVTELQFALWNWLSAKGVEAIPLVAVIGPEIVWPFQPQPHSASAAASLLSSARVQQELALYVGIDDIRLIRAQGRLIFAAANPVGGATDGSRLKGRGLRVPIGYHPHLIPRGLAQATAYVDFERSNPHLRIVGTSGSGKTTAALQIASRLVAQNAPEDVALVAIAPTPRSWTALEAIPHGWGMLAFPQAEKFLQWFMRFLDKRKAEGAEDWVFLFVDDTAALLDAKTGFPGCGDLLGHIAAQGREARCVLIPNTQNPTQQELGGNRVTGNIPDALVLRVVGKNAAYQASGARSTGAERQSVGVGTYSIDGEQLPVHLALALPEHLSSAARPGPRRPRPWETVQVASPGIPGEGVSKTPPDASLDTLPLTGEGGEGYSCNGETYPVGGIAPHPADFDYKALDYRGRRIPWLSFHKLPSAYNEEEVELIRRVQRELGSGNKTMRVIWGDRNSERRQMLSALLGTKEED